MLLTPLISFPLPVGFPVLSSSSVSLCWGVVCPCFAMGRATLASARPHLAHASGQALPPRRNATTFHSHVTNWAETLQGLEIGTHNLEDLHFSMKSRDVAAALARSDGGDDVMCGICMEQPETIQLTRCGHNLCAVCARQLLAVAASSACQCPFCRKYIGGFAACEDKAEA